MLTLYHAPQSRSSRMIWLLEEAGADYGIAYVDIPRAMAPGTGAPDPANPHPDKKVPALLHDGVLITESIAIALYVCDLHPGSRLAPAIGDPLRGPFLSWLAYYAGVIEPVVIINFAGLADTPAFQSTFRGRAEMDARILAALENGPHLLGEAFSAADIFLASLGHWARHMLPEGAVMDEYLARMNARPALARAGAKDAKP